MMEEYPSSFEEISEEVWQDAMMEKYSSNFVEAHAE